MASVPCPKDDGGTCYFQDVAVFVHNGRIGLVGGPALEFIMEFSGGISSDEVLSRFVDADFAHRVSRVLGWARGEAEPGFVADLQEEINRLEDSMFIEAMARTDDDFMIGECSPCGDLVKRPIRRS